MIRDVVISLSIALPDDVGFIWVTADKILARLIHAGDVPSLKISQVHGALNKNNGDEVLLKVWRYFGEKVLQTHFVAFGLDMQRFNGWKKRMNINPLRNYFKEFINHKLTVINKALDKLEEEEKVARAIED